MTITEKKQANDESREYSEFYNGFNLCIKQFGPIYAGAVFAAHGVRPHKWQKSNSMTGLLHQLRNETLQINYNTRAANLYWSEATWLNSRVKLGILPANRIRKDVHFIVLEWNDDQTQNWSIVWKTTDYEDAMLHLKRFSVEARIIQANQGKPRNYALARITEDAICDKCGMNKTPLFPQIGNYFCEDCLGFCDGLEPCGLENCSIHTFTL